MAFSLLCCWLFLAGGHDLYGHLGLALVVSYCHLDIPHCSGLHACRQGLMCSDVTDIAPKELDKLA